MLWLVVRPAVVRVVVHRRSLWIVVRLCHHVVGGAVQGGAGVRSVVWGQVKQGPARAVCGEWCSDIDDGGGADRESNTFFFPHRGRDYKTNNARRVNLALSLSRTIKSPPHPHPHTHTTSHHTQTQHRHPAHHHHRQKKTISECCEKRTS